MSEVEIEEVESEEHITEEVEIEEVIPKVTDRFCKGNMPMALVWYIKFHESQENKSGVARAYFTTVGKISDIQSGSNQKYIVEAMKWSKEELSAMGEVVKANFVRGQDVRMIRLSWLIQLLTSVSWLLPQLMMLSIVLKYLTLSLV